jgi:hypothetical protein
VHTFDIDSKEVQMADDTTIKSLFDYAKQGPLGGGEFPSFPVVFFTLVRQFPPPGTGRTRGGIPL